MAEVFERVGRIDEAKTVLEEALQLAEGQGRLVPAQRARDRIAALAMFSQRRAGVPGGLGIPPVYAPIPQRQARGQPLQRSTPRLATALLR